MSSMVVVLWGAGVWGQMFGGQMSGEVKCPCSHGLDTSVYVAEMQIYALIKCRN